MSMWQRHITDATAQIEKFCSEIRECASQLAESAPSTSTNNRRYEIAPRPCGASCCENERSGFCTINSCQFKKRGATSTVR